MKSAHYSGVWRDFFQYQLTARLARASSAAEGMCSQSPSIDRPCRAAIGYTIGKPLVLFRISPVSASASARLGDAKARMGVGFFGYESALTYLDLAELALVASSLCDRAGGGLVACADGAGRTGRRRP